MLLSVDSMTYNERLNTLNDLGEKGWEVCASHSNGRYSELILKRTKTAKVLYGEPDVAT